jgi:hypothetical protein
MRIVRCLHAAASLAGFGAAPLLLSIGLGVSCATLLSGCDDTKSTGKQVEWDPVTKEQQQSVREATEEAYKERRAAINKRRGR